MAGGLLNFLKASLAALAVLAAVGVVSCEARKGPVEARPAVETVAPLEAKRLIDGGIFVLDVRTASEHARGHIEGARLIPVQELVRRIWELEPVREKELLVYCRTARRSAAASRILADHGFRKVYDLSGGTVAWRRAGLPLVPGE